MVQRDGERNNSAHSYLRDSPSMLKKVNLVVKYIPALDSTCRTLNGRNLTFDLKCPSAKQRKCNEQKKT